MWPWDWIIAAGSGISGLGQKAVDWVNSLIASVMSWVTDAVNTIWRTISNIWNYIAHVWLVINSFVVQVAENIYRWADHEIHIISDWILGMVNQLWAYAQSLYKWATNQLNQVWNFLFQFIHDIYSYILNNIWNPLYQDFQDAKAWASQWFNSVWQYIEHPELLVNLIGHYLMTVWLQLARQFAVPFVRWLIRAMRSMAGEVFDMLENVISSII